MKTVPLIGYSSRLSGRANERIDFMVSSEHEENYTARLFRSVSADPNPQGQGLVEHACDDFFPEQSFQSRKQMFSPGSYGKTTEKLKIRAEQKIMFSLLFYPTLISEAAQKILHFGRFHLTLTEGGHVNFGVDQNTVRSENKVTVRRWYRIEASINKQGALRVSVNGIEHIQSPKETVQDVEAQIDLSENSIVIIAGQHVENTVKNCFNGKIEAPSVFVDGQCVASWDFAKNIQSMTVAGNGCADLELVNAPTRAVTGAAWDGSEMNWQHKPEHYAAISFHQDDIYDFGWETDFSFVIPDNMPSGIYVMRISCGDDYDAMPFFVCPQRDQPTAKLCVLVSTFTYVIYGNHARPDYEPSWLDRIAEWNAYPHNAAVFSSYGLSTYNNHVDGSGICHASHKRPLFNLRPGYITFGQATCSGLRHFQADSHLISWLHAKNIAYDIITDEELHNEGVDAIKRYDAVVTGSHPEYHTRETLDALTHYRDGGGALHYLGGNGFYWRIARHSEDPSLLEIRRAEDGLRAWASEPGEYYNGFDGAYGGLWRRNGRAPQKLVGVGFTAQGTFNGMPYQRVCYDPEFDWVFEGIDQDIIGDFGFSGNGAAGFELDRVDPKLGSGDQITILAQSFASDDHFILVPEEQLTHLTNLSGGPENEVMRADMVYFETPEGGRVFSVGSITFCGSLPWNNFDNTVSRLLLNVLSRSLGNLSL